MYAAAVPALPVRRVGTAAAFYCDVLGFAVVHEDETYAVLRAGDVDLHLWATRRGVRGASPRLAGSASCRLVVSSVPTLASLHARCMTAGVVHPDGDLAATGHGTAEFAVLDPDGNQVTVVAVPDVREAAGAAEAAP